MKQLLGFGLVAVSLAGCSSGDESAKAASMPEKEVSRPQRPAVVDKDTAELMARVDDFRRSGRLEEGAALLENALRENPERPRLHGNLGVIRGRLGDFEAAVLAFENELARSPEDENSYRGLALSLELLGRLDESIPPLERCLELVPADEKCIFRLGRNLSALGRLEESRPYLERAARLRGDTATHAELGLVYRRLGHLNRAADAFANALAEDSAHLATLLGYGQTLAALGRSADSAALLERHRHLSILHDQLESYQRADSQSGLQAEALTDLARLHSEFGDRSAASEVLERALVLNPGSAQVALSLADICIEDGRFGDAQRYIDQARAADPRNPAPGFYLGLLHLARGDSEVAAQAFAESLTMGPWPVLACLDLAATYYAGGELERSVWAYREALKLEPENPEAHVGLARASYRAGEPESAEKAAHRALELDPQSAEAWTVVGTVLSDRNDASAARDAFRRALQLDRTTLLQSGGGSQLLAEFRGSDRARQIYALALEEFTQ